MILTIPKVSSSSIAFFSDSNLESIRDRLGHDHVRHTLEELRSVSRALQMTSLQSLEASKEPSDADILAGYSNEELSAYVQGE